MPSAPDSTRPGLAGGGAGRCAGLVAATRPPRLSSRRTSASRRWPPSRGQRWSTAELDQPGAGLASNVLTGDELDVASRVIAGERNREIAAALFVSEATVEARLTKVYRKLGVRSRTELARRHGRSPS